MWYSDLISTFCFWAERSPAINNLSSYMDLSRSTRLSMVLNIQIVKYLFCSRGAKICENFFSLEFFGLLRRLWYRFHTHRNLAGNEQFSFLEGPRTHSYKTMQTLTQHSLSFQFTELLTVLINIDQQYLRKSKNPFSLSSIFETFLYPLLVCLRVYKIKKNVKLIRFAKNISTCLQQYFCELCPLDSQFINFGHFVWKNNAVHNAFLLGRMRTKNLIMQFKASSVTRHCKYKLTI